MAAELGGEKKFSGAEEGDWFCTVEWIFNLFTVIVFN